MHKEDFVYIEHIMKSILKINEYSKDLTKENFINNEMAQDAIIRNIEIIGEATKRISMNFKSNYPLIPWKEMAGMRDKLIHHYLGVDLDVIWETIKIDIPNLEKQLTEI